MSDDTPSPLSNVIKIDDERIKGHLDRVVRAPWRRRLVKRSWAGEVRSASLRVAIGVNERGSFSLCAGPHRPRHRAQDVGRGTRLPPCPAIDPAAGIAPPRIGRLQRLICDLPHLS
jgi:hypothetical protein